ncbi:MAG: alpha/beta fold hydrolase, partial [Synergistaceae bacterium]|nr:alpha/beta fold hydrolase [Synergistaceae bacterium]
MKKLLLVIAFLLFPVLACAETINLQIDGSQGKLAAQIQKPEDNSKLPMVMILHGFTSKKEFELLKTLADELEKNNIASIRFDFNAHGQSEGKFENMTVLNEIEDAKKVYDYVKNLDYVDTEKISVAGHSQGGVVASMLAGELGAGKIHKVVLFAPAAVLREDAIRGNIFGVAFDAGNPPESVK